MRKIAENLKRLPDMMSKFETSQDKKAEAAKTRENQKKQLLEDVSI